VTITVFAQFTFEALHHWPAAPDEVGFLRDPHRHLFHVRVEDVVGHHDRDREFVLMGREARGWCVEHAQDPGTLTWSCEKWACYLVDRGGFSRVEVSEDGENGAVVCE